MWGVRGAAKQRELHGTHPLSQLLADEWLEDCEQHVEEIRIVDDVNGLQADGSALLHPLQSHAGE